MTNKTNINFTKRLWNKEAFRKIFKKALRTIVLELIKIIIRILIDTLFNR